MERNQEDDYPTFKALRNIDLNLLTVFEAVYVHKGIVNAAKVLNLTPSAISQSIQKLRSTFPDPLFIRKGQGVTPTAYAAHLHEYISQGFESILCALDVNNNYDKERTITLASTPSLGALLMPRIYCAIQKVNPKLSIRNVPIAERQLSQFQADIAIDTRPHHSPGISSYNLYNDRLVAVCRHDHPTAELLFSGNNIHDVNYTFLIMQDDLLVDLRQVINNVLPNRQITFSSYNFLTIASMLTSSDLIGFMPFRVFELYSRIFPLKMVECSIFTGTTVTTTMHINKLSARDAVLQEVIDSILQEFEAA
ncbi:YbeF family transcriptional regulator [Buttiauxella izardii]|nr:YbeF family transcriptional regulator [Buttiauxella izardii]